MNHRRPRTILAPNAASAPVPRRNFLARALGAALGGVFLLQPRAGRAATQGFEPFIGEIALFGFNFEPRGWAKCEGQILPISQNTALFSLLGTMYGGNGFNTFALPDLRGRAPIHHNQGPGLSLRTIGEFGGEELHALSVGELPQHTHGLSVNAGNGTTDSPAGAFPAKNAAGVPEWSTTGGSALNAAAVTPAGQNFAHNNMPPYLVLNWCIALEGIFPSRN